jgi:cobalt-zinc-cadmium efflux system outer membrane protein
MRTRPFWRGASPWLLLFSLTTRPAAALTLEDVRARALAASPELESGASEIRAREAHARQAGLLPNPELRTDVENVGGSGDRESFEETETTLRLSQRIELGGKRGKRRRVAELGQTLAGWDLEATKLAVVANATKAFAHALAAEARLRLADELAATARRSADAVATRIRAGGAPPAEGARARVASAQSEITRQRAARAVASTRRQLAATWGDTDVGARLEGRPEHLPPLPALPDLEARLDATPDLARWTTEVDERTSTMALEEAGRIPDVTVGAGGRHFSDNDDTAFVFELSVPLPVFDRNQGAIAEAAHRLEKARADRDAAARRARTTLASAWSELAAAHDQAKSLRDGVVPAAARALDDVRAAYGQGALSFDDVLDAQRTLFELRIEYVDALETVHVQTAEVERLIGGPIRPQEGGDR